MNTSLVIIFWLIQGWIASRIAAKKAYNPYVWFGIGALFGIFGIAAAFYMRVKKKADPTSKTILPSTEVPHRMWYYLDKEQKTCGPISSRALVENMQKEKIRSDCLVWHEEMSQWEPLEKAGEQWGLLIGSLSMRS